MVEQYFIRFGYLLIPLVSMLMAGYGIRRVIKNDLSEETKLFLLAFVLFVIDVGIRVGWFSVSRMLAGDWLQISSCDCVPASQNAWFWANKVYMGMFTGVSYLIIALMVYYAVDKKPLAHLIKVGVVVLMITTVLASF